MFSSAQPVVRHAVDVNATPEACWKALTDLGTWSRWFPMLKYVSAMGDGSPFHVGGRFEIVFDFPVAVSVKPIVEEVDAPRRVRWVGAGWGIQGDHSYFLEPQGPGVTRVISHEAFSGPGSLLITRRIRERLDGEVHRSLERFKALVEGRT
jgi:uncharacterized protein YndB with AHSA1/START domain